MGYILFPMLALAVFIGVFAIDGSQENAAIPPAIVTQAEIYAQQFIEYRTAVMAYLQNNPTFVGTVSVNSLQQLGYQFSTTFLSLVSNNSTLVGSGPSRTVTCYGALPTGTLADVLSLTSDDYSYGMANNGTWVSSGQGSNQTPQPLATPVPNGDTVAVVVI